MANEQDNEREQILAHFQKLDDAAGDRSAFDVAGEPEASAPVDDSSSATSPEPTEEDAGTEPQDKPEGEEKPEGDASKAEGEGTQPSADDPKGEDGKQGEPNDPENKDSKYRKAQRGRERLDDIRQKAEADKAEAKRLREEAEARHAETKRLIDEAVTQRRPQDQRDLTEGGRFSAQEFERAAEYHQAEAEKAVEAGDLEKYQEHANNAKLTRRAARQIEVQQRQAAEQKARQDFAKAYGETAEKIIKDNPDLGIESELSTKMQALLDSNPILTMVPDGFAKAYEILQLQEKAGQAAGLLERATKAEAEVARLTKLTSPEPGDATTISPTTDFEKLPVEKQREHFRSQFAKADGAR